MAQVLERPSLKLSRKEQFLNALKPGTRSIYKICLEKVESYLSSLPEYEGCYEPLFEAIRRIKADNNLDPLDMQQVERNLISDLIKHLKPKYAPKTIIVTLASFQSFGKYYKVPISTKYTDVPASVSVNQKHEWTLADVGKFIESMKHVYYQAVAATLLQCGLRISDVVGVSKKTGQPVLPYKTIQEEFEAGIVPVCIPIKSSTKTGIEHRTFIGSLAVSKLKLMFEQLGTPEPDAPIFDGAQRTVEGYFARHARKLFGPWEGQNPYCPHGLRVAFSTLMTDAGCPESYSEYFTGHELGDIKKIYKNKSTDAWRAIYRQFDWALDYTVKLEDRPKMSMAELKQIIEQFANGNGNGNGHT